MRSDKMEITFIFIALSLTLAYERVAAQQSCLGIPGACDLSLDEVTLAGAHNAGAGFDGILKYHTGLFGVPALSCPYRNQGDSVYQMMDAGIRYFDIDLCWEDSKKYGVGLWTCHSGAYGGKITKFLDQVERWMNEPKNRNEIVVLHFNRDYSGDKATIEKALVSELKRRWDPSKKDGSLTMQPAEWVHLSVSVKSNQRIYVFVHDDLRQNSKDLKFLLRASYIGYTWTSMGFIGSDGCKKLATAVSDKCTAQGRYRFFVRLDLFLTWGLCNDDLASKCNRYIKYATDRCYANIKSIKYANAHNVNFIVTDYASRKPGTDAVRIARETTLKYIKDKQQT